jgi:hypothetical protein
MRTVFGQKPEPWTVDDAPDMEITIDFDGTQPGIVRVPEAALKRHAVPTNTPVQPGAPIMKARTKAITGAPPVTSAPVVTPAPGDEPTDIVEPLALDGVDLPGAEGPLSVGDETVMVRPATSVSGAGKQIALIAIVSIVAIAVAFFIIRSQQSDGDDPRTRANPNIKLPPPSTVIPPPVQQAVTPDAAEVVVEDAAEVVDEVGSGSAPAVEPRDPTAKKKKKKKRRTVRRPRQTSPLDDEAPGWDRNELFPKTK